MPSIEPTPEQLQRFSADRQDESPIVMINLLRYRDRAQYPPGSTEAAGSGRDAYQRYAAAVTPLLGAGGGTALFMGAVKCILIGPEGEAWDDAILVRYPSRQAFLAMVSTPEYQRVAVHRTAALADSRLIATSAAS